MNNLFSFDNLEINTDILERANPVFNTAKMTLYQLAAAGDEDSIRVVKELGFTKDTQNSVTTSSDSEKLLLESLLMDMRYHTMEKMAMEEGEFTEVDLPCGYLPKALRFINAGHKFVGLDLPATIAEAKPAINALLNEKQRKMAKFAGVDATNFNSLQSALSDVKGKVVITTEGLMEYLSDSEIGAVCDNIRRILEERGGCWLTIDPEWLMSYVLVVRAILGERADEVLLSMQKRVEDKSDVGVNGSALVVFPKEDIANDIKNAMDFLAKHGLKAERMIVADYMPELKSFDRLTEAQTAAVKEVMKKNAYWKITAVGDFDAADKNTGEKNFDVNAYAKGEKLFISLTGRVDTLTAPDILSFYEKISGEQQIKSVRVDCAELTYISRAGIRVFHIMQENSELTFENLTPEIMEILESEGFALF
ncbi:MAG: STAS domain-containing protein [Selenomonadaceae bacterium]|nr:STAS domain-containing protein [Selenomonadaceae bacterium]